MGSWASVDLLSAVTGSDFFKAGVGAITAASGLMSPVVDAVAATAQNALPAMVTGGISQGK